MLYACLLGQCPIVAFLERGTDAVMRVLAVVARRPVWLVLGLFALGLGLGLGLAIAAALPVGPRLATASHLGDDVVHACINRATGQARFILPGRAPNCSPSELLVEWAGGGAVDSLAATVSTLQADFEALNNRVPGCLQAPDDSTALFAGCNVQITNGAGCGTGCSNGKGNLIIGYNQALGHEDRSGSHNLVIGDAHSYESAASLIVGYHNTITGNALASAITGGAYNTVDGSYSTILGGQANTLSGNDLTLPPIP